VDMLNHLTAAQLSGSLAWIPTEEKPANKAVIRDKYMNSQSCVSF
jgi:hypothetical protein